ncbi:FMN reductase [Alicyclobacillus cellulosilyticus]|uniref:FMN reductase n=1 Tax=Alicyclobacillus cellulosilyticus TaxID=1003997 RepID=A0A917KGK1_9BACL|nr:NADPH-dependent FMN reductase [Alicyclobacillus cellulosilyticus]GGJ09184.1 FMN reductase [Alicyclobacillus cellulosilyticus]
MKVVAMVGSLRRDSFNRRLAETVRDRYRDRLQMEFADLSVLPPFNQDEELNPPPVVQAFKAQVAAADAVFIFTPEYNWSVPGVLKNAIDWLSRGERVMVGKPVFIAGASTGMLGTIRAHLHLREILASPGVSARVMPPGGNEVLVNFAADKFAPSGPLVDPATLSFLDDVMERFIQFAASAQDARHTP